MGKENEKKTKTTEKILHGKEVDAIIVTSPANMRYLTGFTGEGYVVLSAKRSRIVTDSRYDIAARMECPACEVVIFSPGEYYKPLLDFVAGEKVRTLGYESDIMTVDDFKKMKKSLTEYEVEYKSLEDAIFLFRRYKTEEEIRRIREAEAIGDRAFARFLSRIHSGMTEKQAAALIEFLMKEEGAEGFSFDTIAASGPHTAMPHAVPTERKLKKGDLLTMDFGCKYQGYCSDMTRTIAIGDVSDKLKQIYETVLKAQQKALFNIRPRMTGAQIDALARDVIQEAGYGEYFGHSLGHSVGLEIHEAPNFSPREETMIEPGMVVSVEPGIYVENVGGVRIEDLIVVTKDGCENLTNSPKHLITVE